MKPHYLVKGQHGEHLQSYRQQNNSCGHLNQWAFAVTIHCSPPPKNTPFKNKRPGCRQVPGMGGTVTPMEAPRKPCSVQRAQGQNKSYNDSCPPLKEGIPVEDAWASSRILQTRYLRSWGSTCGLWAVRGRHSCALCPQLSSFANIPTMLLRVLLHPTHPPKTDPERQIPVRAPVASPL